MLYVYKVSNMLKYVRVVKNIVWRECFVGWENFGVYILMFVEKLGKIKLIVCICYVVIVMNYNNLLININWSILFYIFMIQYCLDMYQQMFVC